MDHAKLAISDAEIPLLDRAGIRGEEVHSS